MSENDDNVEVDPQKMCNQRWAHRAVIGVNTTMGRLCPECFPDAEVIPDEPAEPPVADEPTA